MLAKGTIDGWEIAMAVNKEPRPALIAYGGRGLVIPWIIITWYEVVLVVNL